MSCKECHDGYGTLGKKNDFSQTVIPFSSKYIKDIDMCENTIETNCLHIYGHNF